GEIYNHIELRKQLLNKGFNFSTHSDTEVLLALYSHYKEECVSKLRGMFAFVIWDKVEQKLFGARDYFGIKPFFYSEENGLTYFASEEKSILLALKGELNHISLQHYLSYQYVPEPETMMVQIKKLPPGHYFTQSPGGKLNIKSYWKP
ncbi:asparagine synthetase B, partial [Flavobacterium sp. IR1]